MAVNKKQVTFLQKTKLGVTLNSYDQLNGFFYGLYQSIQENAKIEFTTV